MNKGDIITAYRPKSKHLTHGKEYGVIDCTVYGDPNNPFCVYVWIINDEGKKKCLSLSSVVNK